MNELKQSTWSEKASYNLNLHFDKFSLGFWCFVHILCHSVSLEMIHLLLQHLTILLKFTLKIGPIESIIKISIMLACVLLVCHCAPGTHFLLSIKKGGRFHFSQHTYCQLGANKVNPAFPHSHHFFPVPDLGHSQSIFLLFLGFRDNLNISTSQPQRDIQEKNQRPEIQCAYE